MITTRGESFALKLYKRKPNSSYEWEDKSTLTFFGRPANAKEKKNYRLQAGVHATDESVYILTSNLPNNITIGDRVLFQGDYKTIESIGFYYIDSRLVTNYIMSDKYITERCPKGITLL